ncbi:lysophospholipid acyltransferase family protein [Candidatus Pelagibacter sp.]|jgi:KDO2-lipid IV(A) lauroyltransferase|nr:lysophospholipid acyltransferase family protein [Candidatus Pelagibacter sp.]
MTKLKYFVQFLVIIFLFFIYKIIGLRFSSILSGYIMLLLGPLFRSKNLSNNNLKKALPNSTDSQRKKILSQMWFNYGQILSEYMFIQNFRKSEKFSKKVSVVNQKVLEIIKSETNPVIFISGHFNNFELMAMHIEKSGIDLAAIYRPLNNIFLNPLMEQIRKRYICKKQIKKGISGTKQLLKHFKKKTSLALMIDQRVSEGIRSNFFDKEALTTTIPAQFIKKYNVKVVPIYIERFKDNNFRIEIYDPITFKKDETINSITLHLNKILEKMIMRNPEQWIWMHNRWK